MDSIIHHNQIANTRIMPQNINIERKKYIYINIIEGISLAVSNWNE